MCLFRKTEALAGSCFLLLHINCILPSDFLSKLSLIEVHSGACERTPREDVHEARWQRPHLRTSATSWICGGHLQGMHLQVFHEDVCDDGRERLAHCYSLNLLKEETIKLKVNSSHSLRAVESLYEAQCSKILLQTLTNRSVPFSTV